MTLCALSDQNRPAVRFDPGSGVAVLLPLALPGVLDYRVAAGQDLRPGDFVRVPLGRREAIGVVWGAPGSEANEGRRRDVLGRLDLPPLPESLRRLVDWVAAYTLAEPGMVLKMAMSVPAALEDPGPAPMLVAAAREPVAGLTLTGARKAVLALAATAPMTQAALARQAGVGPSVVAGLLAKGALILVPGLPSMPAGPDWRRSGPALSSDQATAAATLCAGVEAGFSVQLLDGVTGSGKTEVYFEAIAKALSLGRQSLVLLPEIGLSAQWLARFRDRFGADPLVWHSEIGQARRRDGWRMVAHGQAPVVVGARSALFLPFPALGLIVVDEEHDASFKQEDGVIYNARDMAVVRARFSDCPVILSSATPSLETRVNAEQGRYQRLVLPARHGAAQLPEIGLVDLCRQPPARGSWISPPLADAIEAALGASEQAMLFLNRRGYAPLTLCRACGHRLQCPYCSAWLVEHRQSRRLECHHCGHKMAVPKACPSCEAEESLVACGPGVERVAEEAAQRFPAARIAVMASDTLGSPAAAAALVERMAAREIDLLIGTQIVAKGHHFPWLTLVGVVDADLGLEGGDLRAAERTFQLLSQVAGRAGRAERPGRVLLQTFQPRHKVMQALASGQAEAFYREEAAERARHSMPPFGRLAALIVSAGSEAGADAACRRLAATAPVAEMLEILGPAPAPLALLRGRHRRRFLLKAARRVSLQNVVRDWLGPLSFPRDVRIQIDIDPYSFF